MVLFDVMSTDQTNSEPAYVSLQPAAPSFIPSPNFSQQPVFTPVLYPDLDQSTVTSLPMMARRARSRGRGPRPVRLTRGAHSHSNSGGAVRGGVSAVSRRAAVRGVASRAVKGRGSRRRGSGRTLHSFNAVSGARDSPADLTVAIAARSQRGRPRLSTSAKYHRRKLAGNRIRSGVRGRGMSRVSKLLMDEGVINMLRDLQHHQQSDVSLAQRRSAASRAIQRLHETSAPRVYRRRETARDTPPSSDSPRDTTVAEDFVPRPVADQFVDDSSSGSGVGSRIDIDQEMSDIASDSSFGAAHQQSPIGRHQCVEHRVTTVKQSRILSVAGHEHLLNNGTGGSGIRNSGGYGNASVIEALPMKMEINGNDHSPLSPILSTTSHTPHATAPMLVKRQPNSTVSPAITPPTSTLASGVISPAPDSSLMLSSPGLTARRESHHMMTSLSPTDFQTSSYKSEFGGASDGPHARTVSVRRGRGRGRPRLRRPLIKAVAGRSSVTPPSFLPNRLPNGYNVVSSATMTEKQTASLTVSSTLTSTATSTSTATPLTVIQVKKMSRYVDATSPVLTPTKSTGAGINDSLSCAGAPATVNTAGCAVVEPSVSWLNWTRRDKMVKKSVVHVGRASSEVAPRLSGTVDGSGGVGGGDGICQTNTSDHPVSTARISPLESHQHRKHRRRRKLVDVKLVADNNLNLVQLKSLPPSRASVVDEVFVPPVRSANAASDSAADVATDVAAVAAPVSVRHAATLNGDTSCSRVTAATSAAAATAGNAVDFDSCLDATPTSPGSHSFGLLQKRLELATAREAQRSAPGPGPTAGARVARFSLRCNQGSARLREMTVKKFSNFHQIVVCPVTTRLRAGLNIQVMRELRECLSACSREPTCKAVLLTSSAGPFCQGVDYSCLMGLSLDKRKRVVDQLLTEIRNLVLAVSEFEKPLVAGITGDCLGLGVALLPLCDLVYVSEKVTLRTLYHRLATVPEGAVTHTLPSLLGHSRASAVLMAGACLTGSEAVSQGLATALLWSATAHEELINRIRQLVDSIDHVQSVSSTKSLIRHSLRSRVRSSLECECRLLLHQWCSDQFQTRVHQLYHSESVLLMQKPGFDTV